MIQFLQVALPDRTLRFETWLGSSRYYEMRGDKYFLLWEADTVIAFIHEAFGCDGRVYTCSLGDDWVRIQPEAFASVSAETLDDFLLRTY